MPVHLLFDLLAALAAVLITQAIYRWRLTERGDFVVAAGIGYVASLAGGAVSGGYLFGTLNLLLSGQEGIGRSNVGALAGAILGIELFKLSKGIRGSTGAIFAPGFALSVVIGRWGCFLSGLPDFTYGTPTHLPWGYDFGDAIPRHPVQLYESLAMALFLGWSILSLRRGESFERHGFYVLVLYYSGQRFAWEFLKPYATVLGPLNLFHVVCAILAGYAALMILASSGLRGRDA